MKRRPRKHRTAAPNTFLGARRPDAPAIPGSAFPRARSMPGMQAPMVPSPPPPPARPHPPGLKTLARLAAAVLRLRRLQDQNRDADDRDRSEQANRAHNAALAVEIRGRREARAAAERDARGQVIQVKAEIAAYQRQLRNLGIPRTEDERKLSELHRELRFDERAVPFGTRPKDGDRRAPSAAPAVSAPLRALADVPVDVLLEKILARHNGGTR